MGGLQFTTCDVEPTAILTEGYVQVEDAQLIASEETELTTVQNKRARSDKRKKEKKGKASEKRIEAEDDVETNIEDSTQFKENLLYYQDDREMSKDINAKLKSYKKSKHKAGSPCLLLLIEVVKVVLNGLCGPAVSLSISWSGDDVGKESVVALESCGGLLPKENAGCLAPVLSRPDVRDPNYHQNLGNFFHFLL